MTSIITERRERTPEEYLRDTVQWVINDQAAKTLAVFRAQAAGKDFPELAEPEARPDNHEWDQGTWARGAILDEMFENYRFVSCDGGGACVAGHMAVLSGARFLTTYEPAEDIHEVSAARVLPDGGSEVVTAATHALNLLGINEGGDDHPLFSASNDWFEVVELAEEIAEEQGWRLDLHIPPALHDEVGMYLSETEHLTLVLDDEPRVETVSS